MRRQYPIEAELSVPGEASQRNAEPSLSEINRAEKTDHGCPRVIGGDKGDLGFHGYTVEGGRTILYRPILLTSLDVTPNEAAEIAQEILSESYDSIGLESVQ